MIIAVIFLMVMTLLVIYLMRDTLLQERMTSNSINSDRAFQAAEGALREGETRIAAGGPPFDPFTLSSFSTTCANGLCRGLALDAWNTLDWSNGKIFQSQLAPMAASQAPKYVIEVQDPPAWKDGEGCSIATYRILAKGWGLDGAESIVQSHYRHSPGVCR